MLIAQEKNGKLYVSCVGKWVLDEVTVKTVNHISTFVSLSWFPSSHSPAPAGLIHICLQTQHPRRLLHPNAFIRWYLSVCDARRCAVFHVGRIFSGTTPKGSLYDVETSVLYCMSFHTFALGSASLCWFFFLVPVESYMPFTRGPCSCYA